MVRMQEACDILNLAANVSPVLLEEPVYLACSISRILTSVSRGMRVLEVTQVLTLILALEVTILTSEVPPASSVLQGITVL